MPQPLPTAGFVPAVVMTYGRFGEEIRTVDDTSPMPGYSPGGFLAAPGAMTRPADTTGYAAGDLVANAVAAGAVVPVEVANASRAAGEAVRIERVRLTKTGPVLTSASFRVHLFRRPPVVTVGDNAVLDPGAGVLSVTDITSYVGTVDITMNRAGQVGATGVGVPSIGAGITCTTGTTAGKERSLWALIEARGAYTPASAETFTVVLELARS